MAAKPTLGRIVLYTSRHGDLDMPAIITSLVDGKGRHVARHADEDSDQAVHLELFAPPGAQKDLLSHEWGVSHADEPHPGCWHWPERVS